MNNKIKVPDLISAINEGIATFNHTMANYNRTDTRLSVEVVHSKTENIVSIVLSVTEGGDKREISRFVTPKVKNGRVLKDTDYIPLLYKQLMIALLEMSYVYSLAIQHRNKEEANKAQQHEPDTNTRSEDAKDFTRNE